MTHPLVRHHVLRPQGIETREGTPAVHADSKVKFANEDHLEALVSGWPWSKGTTSLLLPTEESIFWMRRGSHGADLVGVTSSSTPVAAEMKCGRMKGLKEPIRQILRGLARCADDEERKAMIGPFGVPTSSAVPIGILVFDDASIDDGSWNPNKFSSLFAKIVRDPGVTTWNGGESKAKDWLSTQALQVHVLAVAVERYSGPEFIVQSTCWDFGPLPTRR